jgi:hypothetical protein
LYISAHYDLLDGVVRETVQGHYPVVVTTDASSEVGRARRGGDLGRKDDRATENDPEAHEGKYELYVLFSENRVDKQLW